MKTYSEGGTPLAEAVLTIGSLVRVLCHPELQAAVSELALDDASREALALAARFCDRESLKSVPFDALHEAYQDLPVDVAWCEFSDAHAARLSTDDAAIAWKLVHAMRSLSQDEFESNFKARMQELSAALMRSSPAAVKEQPAVMARELWELDQQLRHGEVRGAFEDATEATRTAYLLKAEVMVEMTLTAAARRAAKKVPTGIDKT